MTEDEDPDGDLKPARGIFNGLVLALLIWALLAIFWSWK